MTALLQDPGPTPWDAEDLLPGLQRLASHARAASARSAADAVVIADLAARVPRALADERGGSAWTSFLREVAVALRCSDQVASSLVARASQLVRMPVALGLLAAGDLPEAQMRALVEETWPASASALARIDAEVSPRAVRLAPARVRDAVRKVLLREDADALADAAARATALRGARRTPLADDQAEIAFTGPAVVLAQVWETVDAAARERKAAGDDRTLDALRFDLGTALLRGGNPVASGTPTVTPAAAPTVTPTAAPAVTPTGAASPEAPSPAPVTAAGPVVPPCRPGPVRVPEPSRDAAWLTDRRFGRPVRLNITVPVTTALGLSNEPGWLEGHGWISAPTCRQLLPSAELRQLCVDQDTGALVDLGDVTRPCPTPAAAAAALRDMVQRPFDVTDTAWRAEPQHDPTDRLREFVVLRDELCDGPTGTRLPARRSHLDHDTAHPQGPTAAWNLVARGSRTHQLKHRGWTPVRTSRGTTWFSPAGQVVDVEARRQPLRPVEADATLPDPDDLHRLEAELLRPPTPDDDPPDW